MWRSRSNILFIHDWVCLFACYAPLEWWWYNWTPCSLSMRKRCPKRVMSCCFLIFLLHFHLALLVAAAPSIHHALLHMLGLTLTSTPLPSMHTGAPQYNLCNCMWVCSFHPTYMCVHHVYRESSTMEKDPTRNYCNTHTVSKPQVSYTPVRVRTHCNAQCDVEDYLGCKWVG